MLTFFIIFGNDKLHFHSNYLLIFQRLASLCEGIGVKKKKKKSAAYILCIPRFYDKCESLNFDLSQQGLVSNGETVVISLIPMT